MPNREVGSPPETTQLPKASSHRPKSNGELSLFWRCGSEWSEHDVQVPWRRWFVSLPEALMPNLSEQTRPEDDWVPISFHVESLFARRARRISETRRALCRTQRGYPNWTESQHARVPEFARESAAPSGNGLRLFVLLSARIDSCQVIQAQSNIQMRFPEMLSPQQQRLLQRRLRKPELALVEVECSQIVEINGDVRMFGS